MSTHGHDYSQHKHLLITQHIEEENQKKQVCLQHNLKAEKILFLNALFLQPEEIRMEIGVWKKNLNIERNGKREILFRTCLVKDCSCTLILESGLSANVVSSRVTSQLK